MKHCLMIILFLAFASLSFRQKQSAPQSPEKTRTKTFGSSLEKYKTKKQRYRKQQDFQPNQKVEESKDDEVIKIKTNLVVNDVLVTDRNGKVITNLKKDDFIVTEDNVIQTVEIFSRGEDASVSRSIVLIIGCAVPQFPISG